VECHLVSAGKTKPPAASQPAGGKWLNFQREILKQLFQQHDGIITPSGRADKAKLMRQSTALTPFRILDPAPWRTYSDT